jgi:transglutaminase-like putative cysteine protease
MLLILLISSIGIIVYKYNQMDARFEEFIAQQTEDDEKIKENHFGQFSGYTFLTENEKSAYFQIKEMIKNFETNVVIYKDINEEELGYVLKAIRMDYSEYFWSDDFSYTSSFDNENIFEVNVEYPYNREEKERRQAEIEKKYEAFISEMPLELDEYGKVKYVYDYVIRNTNYQINPAEDQNIYSVFGQNASVCTGYARASQFLLNRLGIEANIVHGMVGEESHFWNLVCIDGDYYYMDPTWGELETDDITEPEKNINYGYLCITSEELEKSHMIDQSLVNYPEFTSIEANYFIREKTKYDLNLRTDQLRLQADIQEAIYNGEKYFYLKYTQEENSELVENLIGEITGSFHWYGDGFQLTKTVSLY